MPRHLALTLIEAALDHSEAAVNSVVTVGARMPILTECLTAPSAAGMVEWQGAWTEKVAAAWEGGLAAAALWQDVALRSLFAPLTPVGAAHHALAIAQACSGPAYGRVRANAARLGVPSR
jgi:hypothetical protein